MMAGILLLLLPARLETIPTVDIDVNVLELNVIEPEKNGLGFGVQEDCYQAIAWEWIDKEKCFFAVDHVWLNRDWTLWQTNRKELRVFRKGKLWRIRFNSGYRTWIEGWGRYWDHMDEAYKRRVFPISY